MKLIKIIVLTIVTTLFYTYVGQMVPQKEVYPPKTLEIRDDLTSQEMAEIGKKIAEEKGTCLTCHPLTGKGSGRFPSFEGIGQRAGLRREGMSDVEYLAESIYDPSAYIVEGFNPGMPVISKPPIELNDKEILCVIAFLQSLGGTPTVTMQTELKWQRGDAGASASQSEPTDRRQQSGDTPADGKALVAKYGCLACHDVNGPNRLAGPSLYDVGNRLGIANLYEAVLSPDATVAEGFPPGMMSATLTAGGFYAKVTGEEIRSIVTYLADLKGE